MVEAPGPVLGQAAQVDPWASPPAAPWFVRFQDFLETRQSPIEDSVRVRLATWVNTSLALLAHAFVVEELWPLALAGLAITLGSWLSHGWRRRNVWPVKVILAVGMVAALANTLRDLAFGAVDPRLALGSLLLYLQALNAFDLPRRRNMRVAWLVASILAVASASLSREPSFVLVLAGFALSLAWAAQEAHRADLGEVAEGGLSIWLPAGRISWSEWGATLGALGVVGAVGMATPMLALGRSTRLDVASLPMSLPIPLPSELSPRLRHPSLAGALGEQLRGQKLGTAGFSEQLDLDVRLVPSEALALRVQATEPSYLRALAYDFYDGRTWRLASPEAATTLNNAQPPLRLLPPHQLARGGGSTVATIHVERDHSNVIFAPYEARRIYFPSAVVYRDDMGGLRSPLLLEKELYYTVESSLPPSEGMLGALPSLAQPDGMASYLQLPALSPRVKALARQLGGPHGRTWPRVEAIRDHLARFPYRLDIPPAPQSSEWVDHFLFQQKAGFCQQFATAGAVLAREMGIPARLVTGFMPGTWSPFSGYFEVRGRDAHAWVELHVPGAGWVPVDFTPAADGPLGARAGDWGSAGASLVAMSSAMLALALGFWVLPAWWRRRQEEASWPAAAQGHRLLRRAAARLGVPDAPGLAPEAWLEGLNHHLHPDGPLQAALLRFVQDYAQARFGPESDPLGPTLWRQRAQGLATALQALARSRRRQA